MGYGKADADPHLWPLAANGFITREYYLKLHTEITLLAYIQTGELEEAKDIASECLIAWWEQSKNEGILQLEKPYLLNQLQVRCDIAILQRKRQKEVEYNSMWDLQNVIPACKKFRLADRAIVLKLSLSLDPLELSVIRLIILEELDLCEISKIIGKPVPAVKIIRDRAVYQLKKKWLQGAIPL